MRLEDSVGLGSPMDVPIVIEEQEEGTNIVPHQ
jgi:hypothetical protein